METGFCGIGLMGTPMVRHLLRAGHAVHIWNRTAGKAQALATEGALVVETPQALANRVEVVVLCVADAAAVEEVVFGPSGVLTAPAQPAAPRVRWIVDHSSIPPAATRDLARRAAAAGVGWVDAPVPAAWPARAPVRWRSWRGATRPISPRSRPCSARTPRASPIWAAWVPARPPSCAIRRSSPRRSPRSRRRVGLAQRSGIDAARLSEALAGGWADSVLLRTFVPRMTQSGLAPIGALKTFQKDVDTIAATAAEMGAPMPVSGAVQQVLRLGAALGLADADLSAFIEVVQPRRSP